MTPNKQPDLNRSEGKEIISLLLDEIDAVGAGDRNNFFAFSKSIYERARNFLSQPGPLQKEEIPAAELQRMEKECESLYDDWFSDSDKITTKYWYMQAATAEYLHAHQSVSWPDGGEVPQKVKDWILSQTLFCGGVTVEDNIARMSGFEKGAIAMYRKLAEERQPGMRWVKAQEQLPPENKLVHCKTSRGRPIVTSAAKGEWDNYPLDEDVEIVDQWLEESPNT